MLLFVVAVGWDEAKRNPSLRLPRTATSSWLCKKSIYETDQGERSRIYRCSRARAGSSWSRCDGGTDMLLPEPDLQIDHGRETATSSKLQIGEDTDSIEFRNIVNIILAQVVAQPKQHGDCLLPITWLEMHELKHDFAR